MSGWEWGEYPLTSTGRYVTAADHLPSPTGTHHGDQPTGVRSHVVRGVEDWEPGLRLQYRPCPRDRGKQSRQRVVEMIETGDEDKDFLPLHDEESTFRVHLEWTVRAQESAAFTGLRVVGHYM